MKRFSMIVAAALALAGGAAAAADKAELAAEGKALIKDFATSLKGEFKAAMKEGGPVAAIGVCNVKAPAIAARVSEASGWRIARSSHKLRNPDNAPDEDTAAVIDEFLARQAAGKPARTLARAEIVTEDGQQVFRMVKAIPTGEVCLKCHGGQIVTEQVEAALARLYPRDEARGFAVGEMRGVFTLRRVLAP